MPHLPEPNPGESREQFYRRLNSEAKNRDSLARHESEQRDSETPDNIRTVATNIAVAEAALRIARLNNDPTGINLRKRQLQELKDESKQLKSEHEEQQQLEAARQIRESDPNWQRTVTNAKAAAERRKLNGEKIFDTADAIRAHERQESLLASDPREYEAAVSTYWKSFADYEATYEVPKLKSRELELSTAAAKANAAAHRAKADLLQSQLDQSQHTQPGSEAK